MSRGFLKVAAGSLALFVGVMRADAAVVTIEDFATGEGRFTSATTASGTTAGIIHANSSVTHDPVQGNFGAGSQQIVIDDDPAADVTTVFNWRIRNLSGGGTPANNVSFPSTGYVGFWAKTETPGMTASIIIDDGATHERANYVPITADGQWHLYEWNLDATPASTEWFNFASGNGLIDQENVSIDAVYILRPFTGTGDFDGTILIDDVSHNPTGSLVPEPASAGLLAIGVLGLLARQRRNA